MTSKTRVFDVFKLKLGNFKINLRAKGGPGHTSRCQNIIKEGLNLTLHMVIRVARPPQFLATLRPKRPIVPPPENQFCFYKTTVFLHEVKFCINAALFLCTVLFFSSILMNFSDFGYKMTENSNFLRIELQTSYVPQKKAEIF